MFEHVLVVGAGQMGGGIAQTFAASGRRVSLYDAAPGAVERGLETMRKSLARLAEKGGADPDDVLSPSRARGRPRAGRADGRGGGRGRGRQGDIFRRADDVLPAEAILASNTSSIPIATLAAADRAGPTA